MLVVSPLIALMEDQVQDLWKRKLPAACLHSELDPALRKRVLKALEENRLRLLYLGPETLFSPRLATAATASGAHQRPDRG